MHPRQKAAFDALHRAGYLHEVGEMLRHMNVAFWWSGIVNGDVQILNNGTMCYVDTGTRKIGVTADHVYAKYLEQKATVDSVELQLGENTINIEPRLIDRDSRLDLATFDVPEVFVTANLETHYHMALKWPPDPVRPGEVVIHGGYPQVLRDPETKRVHFGFQHFASAVNEVKAEGVIVLDPGRDPYWPGHEGERLNTEYHGQSGGPVYRVIDANVSKGGTEPVDRFELVGFIYQQLHDLVLARASVFIAPNGTILRELPPITS
jgi:hypothetical protein